MTMAKHFNPFELVFYQFVGNSRTCLPRTDVLRITLFVLAKHSGMTANTCGNLQRFSALRLSASFILFKSHVCTISTNNTKFCI